MAVGRSIRLLVPRRVRAMPADLAAVCATVVLVDAVVFLPIVRETPLRLPLGLVVLLLVPGYVLIAALYPGRKESSTTSDDRGGTDDRGIGDDDRGTGGSDRSIARGDRAGTGEGRGFGLVPPRSEGIDGVERLVLSVGTSVAVVPFLGLGLNATPWGIEPIPVVVSLSALSLVGAIVATVRRWQLPAEDRLRVPYREWVATVRTGLLAPDTRGDAALNVLLVVSIVLAAGSVGYAAATLPQSDDYSAIYLLTEDDGEPIVGEYPSELAPGESGSVVVGVDNHEHRPVEYTIVVLEQTVERDGNETIIREQNELDRVDTTLEHGESDLLEYEVRPTMTGEDVRVVWLLYLEEPPADPSVESAAYDARLLVDVGDGA